MKLKRIMSAVLAVCLLAASLNFTACDNDSVRKTREAAERLVIYSDLGINSIQELKVQGALVGFEEAEAAATQALTEIRDSTKVFVEKAMTFTKFDASSRADLAKMFVAVTDALQKLKPNVLLIATKVIEELNRRSITNIQDPQKIVSKINMALNILDASARLIQSRIAP
jgi:hypothetical protein